MAGPSTCRSSRRPSRSTSRKVAAGRVRISIRDLSKTFREGPREVAAVSRVSFDIFDQEFVAIVGPSGCGKSTILNMIGGLVAGSDGEILVDGQRVAGAPPAGVG